MKSCVVTLINDAYVKGAATTLYSILKNSPGFNSDFIILDWGELSEVNKTKLQKLYDKVIFKPIETKYYEKCVYDKTWREWTYNCNYRFDIFCLEEYDKVIFMDSDFLNLSSIMPLIEMNTDFAVVPGIAEYIPQYRGKNCFDAGLMVVGKKYLHSQVRDELADLSLTPAPSSCLLTNNWASDEPILNVYFEKHNKVLLDQKYNFLTTLLKRDTLDKPNNYQFNGPKKPWVSDKITDCFNDFMRNELFKTLGTAKALLLLNKLLKTYRFYMKHALDIIEL